MATLAATIKYANNIAEQVDAMKKFEDQIVATTAGANKFAQALGGDKTLVAANNLVAAVNQLKDANGNLAGASALTERQQASVNKQLVEAIAKYEALGKQAPTAMLQLAEATKKVDQPTQGFLDKMRAAVPTAQTLTNQVQSMALGYVAGAASLETLKRAGDAVIDFMVESIHEATEADQVQRQLTQALSQQGTAIPNVLTQYNALADKYQDTTVYGDELIKSTETLLVQVGNVMPGQMDEALRATTDLAAGLGIDLKQAAMLVAKSFEDNFGALKKAGVQIDATRAQAEGMEYVLGQIEQRFGGQAIAAARSYEGQLKQLENEYKNLQEAVGGLLVGTGLAPVVFAAVTGEVKQQAAEIKALGTSMQVLAAMPGPLGAALRLVFPPATKDTKAYADATAQTNAIIGSYMNATKGAHAATASYSDQLKLAKEHVAGLTDQQRRDLAAALELNAKTEELTATFHLSAAEIDLFKKQLSEHAQASTKAAAEQKKHREEMAEWASVVRNSAATSLTTFLDHLQGATTVAMPAHLVAAKATAEAHKVLGNELSLAVIEMHAAGLSTDEITKRLIAARAATDDDRLAIAGLVDHLKAMTKEMQAHIVPLDKFLQTIPGIKLHLDAATTAATAVAEAHRKLSPAVAESARVMLGAGLSAQDVFEKLKAQGLAADADKPKIEALANAHKGLETSLSMLSRAFADLSQISEGSLGSVLKGAGSAVAGVNVMTKGFGAAKTAMTAMGTDGKKSFGDILANVGGLAAGITSMIGPAIQGVTALINNFSNQTKKAREEFAQSMGTDLAGLYDQLRLFGAKGQELANTGLNVIGKKDKEANEKWIADVKKALAELTPSVDGMFQHWRDGAMSAQQVADLLNSKWQGVVTESTSASGLLNGSFLELVASLQSAGQEVDHLGELMAAQTDKASNGLTTFLTVGSTAYATLADSQKTLTDLQAQYTDASGDDQAKIANDIAGVTAQIETQKKVIAAAGVTTASSAAAMGSALTGVFAKLVEGGASTLEAVNKITPGVSALEAQLKATGLSGGAAFDQLKTLVHTASDEVAGPALSSVNGLNDALVGMKNLGILNQDTFAGLGSQVAQTYTQLVSQGQDGNAVLSLMQPTLQTLWELQHDFGYVTDDATQKLIDQASATGLVGEKHKSVSDQMLDLTKRMTEAMEKLAGITRNDATTSIAGMGSTSATAFGEVASNARDAAAEIRTQFNGLSFNVPVQYDYGGAGSPGSGSPTETAHAGAYVAAQRLQRFHSGTSRVLPFMPRLASDEVPAILQTGEAVLRRSAVQALGVDAVEALNRAGQGGAPSAAGGGAVLDFSELRDEMRQMRLEQARRDAQGPQALARAVRDELQKVVGR